MVAEYRPAWIIVGMWPTFSSLGEGAGLVVHVPRKGVGNDQAFGSLDTERVRVGDLRILLWRWAAKPTF